MTISSTSTFEEIEAEYLDTLAYEREGSVTKAFRHAEACRALRLVRPNLAVKGSNQVSYAAENLIDAENKALAYARATQAQQQGGSTFIRGAFNRMRDRG